MPLRAPRPVIIFDFDGTLADTWRDIATALNRTLVDAGLPTVDGPDVRFWIGDGVVKLLERALPEGRRSEGDLDQLYQSFRNHYDRCCLDTTETYPGIIECLDQLGDAVLAVASNKPGRFLDRVLGGLGLKPYFGVVLAGDTLPTRKPDPQVVRHVLSRVDVVPTGVWMVGDSAVDVETGRASGARTIGCGWGLRGRDELRQAGVDHLIESPREIPPLVRAAR